MGEENCRAKDEDEQNADRNMQRILSKRAAGNANRRYTRV
jgi:hypothetical protein